ncbi:hypothetical protein EJ03DRAFT_324043 [Teratosphaeria nubilosa]|uniref:YMC020W-like alpha/beta hydrolase domain-containing protein n=1 Tax=Teratosphaeria nubilosa TaxID=161662 RepID=A0A6G1LJ73_9PEZI|nr:hypothetical protein EJ03DRAFT_324043 [Teratosphaeria nubilosa]
MAPPKRKSTPSPDEPQHRADASQPNPPQNCTPRDAPQPRPSTSQPSPNPASWYNGGSWRSKASPVTQIVNENIHVARGATSEATDDSSRRPSQSVSKSVRGSRKSVPLVAEATRVHATSDASDKSRPPAFASRSEEKMKGIEGPAETKEEVKPPVAEAAPLPPPPEEDSKSTKSSDTQTARPQSGAWFGWWSRPDGYGSDGELLKADSNKRRKIETDEASNTPLPGTPEAQPTDTAVEDRSNTNDVAPSKDAPTADAAQWEGLPPEMSINPNASAARSWFGLWSRAQNQQAQAEAHSKKDPERQEHPPDPPEVDVPAKPAATEAAVKSQQDPTKQHAKKQSEDRPKSSGWAFWSSDTPKDHAAPADGAQREVGELAVADTPSQSHPEAAQFNEQRDEQQKSNKELPKEATVSRTASLLRRKKVKVEQVATSGDTTAVPTPSDSNSKVPTPAVSGTSSPAPPADVDAPKAVQRGKQPQTRPNHILPSFRDTYPIEPNPGYVERLTTYLAQTLRIQTPETPPNHVYIDPTPRRVKKAIAIGIHGFFPAPLIQRVLGQPTGTSIRFSNYAAASIKHWCQTHQPSTSNAVEIEKVALEGEGMVADRVITLWKLLLNWLSHLRTADFILVACHSQGVPVAFMLIAKLLQLGALHKDVRIGVCAMAGINLGPFLEYKSRLFGGSALELFDFCDSKSRVSRAYTEALDVCLRHGVRVTLIGSLDDQLVSLESSLYAPLSHPYIHRAVFIDGRLHAPDNFLAHLVTFALKLRNLGVSDHGLLRELSAPLAGSLVGGEGHSRVYDDPAVYALAIDYALSSTDLNPSTPPQQTTTTTATSSLLATDRALLTARRASLSGYPPNLPTANSIRRGSIPASTHLPGLAPVIAPYEPLGNGAAATPNPFYLPWAVRGMLGEEAVMRDVALSEEVRILVGEFEGWRPGSKVLRDVRWRLEGVRAML